MDSPASIIVEISDFNSMIGVNFINKQNVWRFQLDRRFLNEKTKIIRQGIREAVESNLYGVEPSSFETVGANGVTGPVEKLITVLYVREIRDSRWRSTGIPPAVLILAGLAERAGFTALIRGISLHEADLNVKEPPGLIAIGLYEDLFLETRKIIQKIKSKWHVPVIVGGPMATLTPVPLLVHLPEADYILRGEVEDTFPVLLRTLAASRDELQGSDNQDLENLWGIPGLAFQNETTLVLGDFDTVPTLSPESEVPMSFHLIPRTDLQKGIEYSTSRGCPRRCTFCSHVHGSKIRPFSLGQIENHLSQFVTRLKEFDPGQLSELAGSVNFNDDDLLLDPDRCRGILEIVAAQGLKLWGVQSSLATINAPAVREKILSLISRKEFFQGNAPIIWIGTDAFSSSRLKRLKKFGTQEQIRDICRDLDAHKILGCHYWIMTDGDSTWRELIDELIILTELKIRYPNTFRVLPNAATLVPYPSTEIYRQRISNHQFDRIIMKTLLTNPEFPGYDYPLISHERPQSSYLYAMIEPGADVPERLLFDPWKFIEWIRAGEFHKCFSAAVQGFRREIADNPELPDSDRETALQDIQERIHRFETLWQ